MHYNSSFQIKQQIKQQARNLINTNWTWHHIRGPIWPRLLQFYAQNIVIDHFLIFCNFSMLHFLFFLAESKWNFKLSAIAVKEFLVKLSSWAEPNPDAHVGLGTTAMSGFVSPVLSAWLRITLSLSVYKPHSSARILPQEAIPLRYDWKLQNGSKAAKFCLGCAQDIERWQRSSTEWRCQLRQWLTAGD